MAQLEKDTRSSRRPDTRRTRALDNVAAALGEPIGTIKDLYRLRNLISEFWPLVDASDRDNRITEQLLSNYKPVLMFCSEDELEKVRGIIEWHVCEDSSISEQTKDILRKMFTGEKKKENV